MDIISPDGKKYKVGRMLKKPDGVKLFECLSEDNKLHVLKIGVEASANVKLDKEALILELLLKKAEKLEAEYTLTNDSDLRLNYNYFFPNFVDSFISEDQKGRRINIYDISMIANEMKDLLPLFHLSFKMKARIDPRTSAWIIGKYLKFLAFTHDMNISIGNLSNDNLLVNGGQHYVSVFDWSKAELQSEMKETSMAAEISAIGTAAIFALGGSIKYNTLPEHPDLQSSEYADFIFKLASGGVSDAYEEHKLFYKMIRSLWAREFHPFTTISL